MARPLFRLLPIALLVSAGWGSDSTSPQPTPGTGDISIVRGASLLTTTAFSPNPKTISLADGGVVRWVNADGGSAYGGGRPTGRQIKSDEARFARPPPFTAVPSYTNLLCGPGP